jgi:PhnB protein
MLHRAPRNGYHSVTPRIVVDDVDRQIAFLRKVFDANGEVEPGRPAEIDIGDSRLLVSDAVEREPFPGFL